MNLVYGAMAEELRYPIGPTPQVTRLTPEERAEGIEVLRALPKQVARAVAGLSDPQLDTPYRADGWTVRQVVHHLADAHSQALGRLKLTLTESEPTIKPYHEELWAQLPDSQMDIAPSLAILGGVHARWVALLSTLQPEDWQKSFIHPDLLLAATQTHTDRAATPQADTTGRINLDQLLSVVAWHGLHHTAHILNLRQRKGW